jgi:septum formation protein
MKNKIILASQSPRRKQLLEWANIDFDIIISDAAESYPSNMKPEDVAVYIAKNKANAIVNKFKPTMPVLAADTIVVCESKIIGKPTDRKDAIQMIQTLSGKTHQVITGVYIHSEKKSISFHDSTKVSFYDLTEEQITYYVDQYKPYDKAGAYAIQEWIGVIGIKSIEGDFYNVMGLPESKVVRALRQIQ